MNRSLIIDPEMKPYHASLYNLAATYTRLNGGQVYLVDAGNMPLNGTSINALFRSSSGRLI